MSGFAVATEAEPEAAVDLGRVPQARGSVGEAPAQVEYSQVRTAQRTWADTRLSDRLRVIRRARTALATRTGELTDAICADLARGPADTLAAEVLPLLAAMRYLEQDAARVLGTRRLGRRGRPVWLAGVTSEVERAPVGVVLVIGPANYPLLLPGVQVLQALVAGNAAVWKPGRGGRAGALVMGRALRAAGLPEGLLTVTDESVAAAEERIRAGVDKVVLTGSAAAGRAVLRMAAETLTPAVAELSGSDAVVVLPGAKLQAVAEAVAFGLRLNGSATCMAPRRLLVMGATAERRTEMVDRLLWRLATVSPVHLPEGRAAELREMVEEATAGGAVVIAGELPSEGVAMRPLVLAGVRPEMRVAQADVFAPVLSVMEVADEEAVLALQRACPLGLTAAIFFGEAERTTARSLARRMEVGTVLLNDVIVATADPRVPFTARRGSGFGSTRGAEGLLEMTVPRVIAEQRGRGRRRYQPTGAAHAVMFAGLAAAAYAGSVGERWRGARQMVAGAGAAGRQE